MNLSSGSKTLKLQYASDLHLEFDWNRKYMERCPLKAVGDVLVLAGDITTIKRMKDADSFLDRVSSEFEHVYWVAGNHEYYYSDLSGLGQTFHERLRSNVSFLNNTAILRDGVKLLFTSLWSKISPENEYPISKMMGDFEVIGVGKQKFMPSDFSAAHERSMDFLRGEEVTDRTVVVTHHVPTFLNYPPEYKGDILNQAFATELHDFIEEKAYRAWIFGHHHRNVSEFKIGETRMLTNQLGYLELQENKGFDNAACIEV